MAPPTPPPLTSISVLTTTTNRDLVVTYLLSIGPLLGLYQHATTITTTSPTSPIIPTPLPLRTSPPYPLHLTATYPTHTYLPPTPQHLSISGHTVGVVWAHPTNTIIPTTTAQPATIPCVLRIPSSRLLTLQERTKFLQVCERRLERLDAISSGSGDPQLLLPNNNSGRLTPPLAVSLVASVDTRSTTTTSHPSSSSSSSGGSSTGNTTRPFLFVCVSRQQDLAAILTLMSAPETWVSEAFTAQFRRLCRQRCEELGCRVYPVSSGDGRDIAHDHEHDVGGVRSVGKVEAKECPEEEEEGDAEWLKRIPEIPVGMGGMGSEERDEEEFLRGYVSAEEEGDGCIASVLGSEDGGEGGSSRGSTPGEREGSVESVDGEGEGSWGGRLQRGGDATVVRGTGARRGLCDAMTWGWQSVVAPYHQQGLRPMPHAPTPPVGDDDDDDDEERMRRSERGSSQVSMLGLMDALPEENDDGASTPRPAWYGQSSASSIGRGGSRQDTPIPPHLVPIPPSRSPSVDADGDEEIEDSPSTYFEHVGSSPGSCQYEGCALPGSSSSYNGDTDGDRTPRPTRRDTIRDSSPLYYSSSSSSSSPSSSPSESSIPPSSPPSLSCLHPRLLPSPRLPTPAGSDFTDNPEVTYLLESLDRVRRSLSVLSSPRHQGSESSYDLPPLIHPSASPSPPSSFPSGSPYASSSSSHYAPTPIGHGHGSASPPGPLPHQSTPSTNPPTPAAANIPRWRVSSPYSPATPEGFVFPRRDSTSPPSSPWSSVDPASAAASPSPAPSASSQASSMVPPSPIPTSSLLAPPSSSHSSSSSAGRSATAASSYGHYRSHSQQLRTTTTTTGSASSSSSSAISRVTASGAVARATNTTHPHPHPHPRRASLIQSATTTAVAGSSSGHHHHHQHGRTSSTLSSGGTYAKKKMTRKQLARCVAEMKEALRKVEGMLGDVVGEEEDDDEDDEDERGGAEECDESEG